MKDYRNRMEQKESRVAWGHKEKCGQISLRRLEEKEIDPGKKKLIP